MKIFVTISFNKSLPDYEGFSLSKVIDESVKILKRKQNENIYYKVISRHRKHLSNNRHYHYINVDNYYLKLLSIIIKVMFNRLVLKRYFDSSSRENIKYILSLATFILFNIKKSDLILFHGSYKVLILFSKIFKNYNFIYYRHGGNMMNIPKNDLEDIISFCRGRIIHVSESTYRQIKVARKKSTFIHNGLNDNQFKSFRLNRNRIRSQIRKINNLDDHDLVFFMGGIIWKPKGYHLAINALSKYKNKQSALFIAGDLENAERSYVDELKNLSKEKNVKTIFLGRLNSKALYKHMIACDIGLQLSDTNNCVEGISIIILEMMFLGLPVICSQSGGNCEIIKDKYSGVVVKNNEFESQLENSIRLLNESVTRKQIGINGLNTVQKNFSSISMTNKLLNYLQNTSTYH